MASWQQKQTEHVAHKLGVTRAGLEWLARAHAAADGHASRRGAEVEPLIRDGYAEDNGREVVNYAGTPYATNYRVAHPTITEAGRTVVRQARGMGW